MVNFLGSDIDVFAIILLVSMGLLFVAFFFNFIRPSMRTKFASSKPARIAVKACLLPALMPLSGLAISLNSERTPVEKAIKNQDEAMQAVLKSASLYTQGDV